MKHLLGIAPIFVPLAALCATGVPAPPHGVGRLTPTADMHDRRADHTATLLPDGRVLIAGGMVENGVFLSSAELYDPARGAFAPAGAMSSRRVGHTATLLRDGRVLIAGGLAGRLIEGGPGVVATTEIYDPADGRFTAGPTMTARRTGHAAVRISNGRVLLAGGGDADDDPLASAELYDPATGRVVPTGRMSSARSMLAAALLKDGRILVTGGVGEARRVLASAEIYDPATGVWRAVGSMTAPREKHSAATLADGRVLIVGGSADPGWHPVRTAELFDPRSGTFSAISDMDAARFKLPNATAGLEDGNVLVAGGATEVEVYDAAAGRFRTVGSLDGPHFFASATPLRDGTVLISGGYGRPDGRANGPLSTDRAWVYRPDAR